MTTKRKGVIALTPIHYNFQTCLTDFTRSLGKRLIVQAYLRGHIRAVTVVRLFARFDLSGD
jgi:hypothetical protein